MRWSIHLIIKCIRALKQTQRKRIVIAGGVGANKKLRERLKRQAADIGVETYYPRPEFCTDNGAMIAYAGSVRLGSRFNTDVVQGFEVKPRWSLEQI